MSKWFFLSITTILLVTIVLSSCDAYGKTPLTEEQALNILVSKIKKDKLYDSWTTLSCFSFRTEKKTKNYIDIGIHEKHGGKCPGDPNTFPIVDRFRVNRFSGKVQWYDTEMELYPYKAVLKWRKTK